MSRFIWKISLILLAVIVCFSNFALAAEENLDEMIARKARQATATWGQEYVEDSSNHYLWQPETLCYYDLQTGHEVWRLSNTPALANIFHDDIGVTPWSADGKRLAFQSNRDTGAFTKEFRLWMIVNTDGSYLKPIINGPARVVAHNPYFHWSPQTPDVYYDFGRYYSGNTGVQTNVLYKATVSDEDVTRVPLLTFPTAHGTELFLNKTISGDGNKVIAMPWNESWWYPATIYPDAGAKLDDPDGYTSFRGLNTNFGDTPDSYTALHDQYYAGDGTWMFILPSGTHAWWRIKVLGGAADGGSRYTEPFNEQWPENTVSDWGGTRDPFGCDYWSHFVPDRWGTHALFSSTEVSPLGPGVWDINNHEWVVKTFGGGTQHHDWHGFTDWNISTSGGGLNDKIYTQKYNDAGSQQVVCYTHTLYNNGGSYAGSDYEYSSLPRPGQSPDGTKVAFHSTFLNAKTGSYDTSVDVYWAVAYYPYPPILEDASKVGSYVRLNWDSPKYTTRGWPNEQIDSPPEPKEIKSYHVWVSEDNINWSEITTTGVPFGTNYLDILQSNGTTRYYAATSEEHSRLESRTLSNTWRVTLDADGNIIADTQENAYPNNPGGVDPFWTQKPANPLNLNVEKQAAQGQYLVTWSEPNDPKIRFYNIYYSTTGTPPADQRFRIASVPVGTTEYLDWCADPSSDAYYLVTSVDRLANESNVAVDSVDPTVPTGIGAEGISSSAIVISWNSSYDNVGVAGYKIFRDGTEVGTTSTTTYNDSGLGAETSYSYRVSAFDYSGNESALSTQVSASTSAGALTGDSLKIIAEGDSWKYYKGTISLGSSWSLLSYDDSSWLIGASGIGFGDGDDATVLSDMQNNYITVYARKTFNINDPSEITSMILSVDYDDGFVAYLNGQEVARSNISGTPSYDAPASGYREAGIAEEIDISPYINNMIAGTNLLAIEVHNGSIDSSDVSLIPELSVTYSGEAPEVDMTPPSSPGGISATVIE